MQEDGALAVRLPEAVGAKIDFRGLVLPYFPLKSWSYSVVNFIHLAPEQYPLLGCSVVSMFLMGL